MFLSLFGYFKFKNKRPDSQSETNQRKITPSSSATTSYRSTTTMDDLEDNSRQPTGNTTKNETDVLAVNDIDLSNSVPDAAKYNVPWDIVQDNHQKFDRIAVLEKEREEIRKKIDALDLDVKRLAQDLKERIDTSIDTLALRIETRLEEIIGKSN